MEERNGLGLALDRVADKAGEAQKKITKALRSGKLSREDMMADFKELEERIRIAKKFLSDARQEL